MEHVQQELIELRTELAAVKEQLTQLTLAVEKLSGTTSRMDDHIDFVETTYSALRSPLEFVKRRIEGFTGTTPALPGLEDCP